MTDLQRVAVCGAGFIGQHLIRQFVGLGAQVSVLDHKSCPPEFAGRTSWLTGEFANRENMEQTLDGVGVAYHLVSSTVPGDVSIDPTRDLSENVLSTLAFLDVCVKCHVKRVVFVSSSSVYGLQATTPIAEDAETNPISSHGIQKLTIEKYLLLYQFHHGIDMRIIRLANPFGPGQSVFGRQGFVAIVIGHLLKDEPILIRDGGRPVRDFIYIDDVARALVLAGRVERAPAILNLGSGVGYSLQQMVAMLEGIMGRSISTVQEELRKAEIPTSVLNVARSRACLGFEPTVSVREGLVMTLQHHGIPTPLAG